MADLLAACPEMIGDAEIQVEAANVAIPCKDGVSIAATLVRGKAPTHFVIISSGTGFKRSYYLALAEYLAAKGAAALVYDYRGIGQSATVDLLRTVDLPDWGRLDLAACIDWASREFSELPLHHLGHSAGGHIVGFAPNAGRIHRHAFVAVGSGTWWRHWPQRWALELFFWWGIGALSLLRSGHIMRGGGWQGEPLPGPAFRTWRRWAHKAAYYRSDIESGLFANNFAAIETPIRSWVLTDDGIATERTAQDILDCFPSAPASIAVRSPQDIGVPRIGHEGAFKERCAPLWEEWRAWLVDGV